jgi:hypothetical protein
VLVGIPVWFIDPWLVVPALLVTELVWIAVLQWPGSGAGSAAEDLMCDRPRHPGP